MNIRSLPILIFTLIVLFSRHEVMASKADKEILLSDTSAIVNTGGTPAQAAGEEVTEDDTLSSEMIKCNNERDTLYIDLSNRGMQFIQEGRFEAATGVLKEAIAVKPDLPHAYINLANAYYHLRKYEDSIETSKTALIIDPVSANSYGNLGSVYTALGKKTEARESYKKALELFRKEGNEEAVKKIEESLAKK